MIRIQKHVTIVEAHPYHWYALDDRPAGCAIVERAFDARCPRCRGGGGADEEASEATLTAPTAWARPGA